MVLRLALCTLAVAALSRPAGALAESDEAKQSADLHPKVKIETNRGEILVELDGEKAPVSTMNFIRYAESDFYDGTIFHRVIENFMIQGGGHTEDGSQKTEGLRGPIVNEWKNGLKNVRGSIAMARLGGNPDSATCQFFINVVDNVRLDMPQADNAGYAVFGKVVEGMDVVDVIRTTDVSTNPAMRSVGPYVPTEPVVIKDVAVVNDFDREAIEAAAARAAAKVEQAQREKLAGVKDELEKAKAAAEKEFGEEAVVNDSGLIHLDIKEGEGSTPGKTDRVKVHYTGWLTDGTKFDSSVDRGTPFVFNVGGGVIRGWLEGVATMKVGGKRRLIIPPDMGYGTQGFPPKIPANAVLVFDVELLEIVE